MTRPYSVGSTTTSLLCLVRLPIPLDVLGAGTPLVEVGAGTPLVEVGAKVDLVALDCPTFVLLDDPLVAVVGDCRTITKESVRNES